MLLGLTGRRRVGKSTIARILEEEHGFYRIHTFGGGLAAALAYLSRYVDEGTAQSMVYGELKDVPSPVLPGGVAPRVLLEGLGRFWGTGLGVEWTLGLELARARRFAGNGPVVVESVVYEADYFRAQGGIIVRVVRPGHDGPAGAMTDDAQERIFEDVSVANDGDINQLRVHIITAMQRVRELDSAPA